MLHRLGTFRGLALSANFPPVTLRGPVSSQSSPDARLQPDGVAERPAPSLVSVLMAARNESRRIGECLDSLAAQSYRPIEIVVIDDGSTDDTADRASRKGATVLRRPASGKAVSIAAGAECARGDVFLFLDADMVFQRDYVGLMVAPILSGQAIGTAHAIERVANPDNVWSRCWQRRAGLPVDRRIVLGEDDLAAGSAVFRAVSAEAFRRVGGFDDVGYFDDQTLAPKLERRAQWVLEAACSHYNVETLGEVRALGRWGSHSIALREGKRAWATYTPPRMLFRALRECWRRGPAMAIYGLAWEWGVFTGLLGRRRSG